MYIHGILYALHIGTHTINSAMYQSANQFPMRAVKHRT